MVAIASDPVEARGLTFVPVRDGIDPVALRRIPYPYKAMLAICSDLDKTPTRHAYWEIVRFLNSTAATTMGDGVGLEVGNTIYFDMPPDQFAYWNTDDHGRAMVRSLIRSGHIDCLHSFGDMATTRAHAARALDELSRHDCRLEVWVDHSVAPSNLGTDIMRGQGNVPGSLVYHADLSCSFGIRFVWVGRVTSVLGQDIPRDLGGIFTLRHPIASSTTLSKEFAKGLLPTYGGGKYALHRLNVLLRSTRLRSGHYVDEFMRSNPHWRGVSCGDTADGLPQVLTERLLERLMKRQGFCVLYTHLGKTASTQAPLGRQTCDALRRLAEFDRAGKILVTTTRRLLGYARTLRQVKLSTATDVDGLWVNLELHPDTTTSSIDGLSINVPDAGRTRVCLNGRELLNVARHGPDGTGRQSVSLPWNRLELPHW